MFRGLLWLGKNSPRLFTMGKRKVVTSSASTSVEHDDKCSEVKKAKTVKTDKKSETKKTTIKKSKTEVDDMISAKSKPKSYPKDIDESDNNETDELVFTEPLPKRNSKGQLVFPDQADFRPLLTPKEVLAAGSFGGTYFRPIKSSVTGKSYSGVWKELPKDWLEGLNISKQIEDEEVEDFKYEQLCDLQNGCRVTALAWSPETSITTLPRDIRFAAAGSDNRIRVFNTDLRGNDSVKIFEGHTDFVNSLTFDPETGDRLASVGDDKWCRIWDRDGNQELSFPLGAQGMSVCWHRDEPLKVMVAQKDGVVKIFSLIGQMQLMSFDAGQVPLMEADWSVGNKGLLIGAVAGSEWVMFDVSVSSRPVERRPIHVEGTRYFRWAKCHNSLVATVGRPGRQIKVFNAKTPQAPLTISQPITYSISWHQKLPAFAAGGDQKVHIYMFDSM